MGWVYFLQADNGLTKIGCTKNIDRRIKQLVVKLPYELKLKALIETEHYQQLEKEIQTDLCADYHVRGEWFRVPTNIYEYLVDDASYYGRVAIV